MMQQVAFIAQVKLGPKKMQEYRLEAEAEGVTVGDFIKDLVERNWSLIFGDEMNE